MSGGQPNPGFVVDTPTTKIKRPEVLVLAPDDNMTDKLHHSHHKIDTLPRTVEEMSKSLREANESIKHQINYKHYAIMTVFFLILILCMVYLLYHDSHKCTIDQETVDKCVRRLMFKSDIPRFPRTDKQLDAYCEEKHKSITCLRQFVEGCLSMDKRRYKYFRKYVNGYKRQLDKTCLQSAQRQKFIQYSGCLPALFKNESHCFDNFQNQIFYIWQHVEQQLQEPGICCAFHQRTECLERQIFPGCRPEVKSFVLDNIKGPFRALTETLCEPHHSSSVSCRDAFDQDDWDKIFGHPEALFNGSMVIRTSDQHGAHHGPDDPLVRLKFYERFLALMLLKRPVNKLSDVEPDKLDHLTET